MSDLTSLAGISQGQMALSSNRINKIEQMAKIATSETKKGEKPVTAEMEKAAKDFEALLLHQMIQSMAATVPKGGLIDGGNEQELYKDMFNEALANDIASGDGIGIKEVILKELSGSRS